LISLSKLPKKFDLIDFETFRTILITLHKQYGYFTFTSLVLQCVLSLSDSLVRALLFASDWYR